MTLFHKFKTYVRENALIESGDSLLLAISGGMDSMVLAELILQLEIPLGLAHVNHGLRGEESDMDENFVRDYAQTKGLPFFASHIPQEAWSSGNKQEVARNFRYGFFEKIRVENQFSKIVTAHHLDDQTETFLMNAIRGSGLQGLSGIPLHKGQIIRPLLFATKESIRIYASQNNIAYREDSSNQLNTYSRNSIRNQIIPALEKTFPHAQKGLYKTLNNTKNDFALLQGLVEAWSRQHAELYKNIVRWKIADLKTNANPVTLLFHLLDFAGFNEVECADMLAEHNSAKHWISKSHEVWLEDGKLSLSKLEQPGLQPDMFQFDAYPSVLTHGDHTIQIVSENLEMVHQPWVLDPRKMPLPLIIRAWKTTDEFRPVHMKGRRKEIKKMISELKIPMALRKNVKVLVNGNQEVVAVLPGILSYVHVKKYDKDYYVNLYENGRSILYIKPLP